MTVWLVHTPPMKTTAPGAGAAGLGGGGHLQLPISGMMSSVHKANNRSIDPWTDCVMDTYEYCLPISHQLLKIKKNKKNRCTPPEGTGGSSSSSPSTFTAAAHAARSVIPLFVFVECGPCRSSMRRRVNHLSNDQPKNRRRRPRTGYTETRPSPARAAGGPPPEVRVACMNPCCWI